MASDVEKKWRDGQIMATYAFLAALADHFTRDVVRSVTGMSFLELAGGLYGGKALANLTGVILFEDEELEDWKEAESTIYDWWGLQYFRVLGLPVGSVLSLIPNPVGVAEVLFESGKMIGEAALGEIPRRTPGIVQRYEQAYLADPESFANPHRR